MSRDVLLLESSRYTLRLAGGRVRRAEMKHKAVNRFVLCIRNDGSDDLEPRKVYQVIADPDAAEDGYIRIIDESGEDYLYPAGYFVPIELPENAAKALGVPV